jgi:hypothetical protein
MWTFSLPMMNFRLLFGELAAWLVVNEFSVFICYLVCLLVKRFVCFPPGLLGFWTLSVSWYSKNTKEHSVSENGSVSVLRCGRRLLLYWVS